jgi:hypothetical protein
LHAALLISSLLLAESLIPQGFTVSQTSSFARLIILEAFITLLFAFGHAKRGPESGKYLKILDTLIS